MNKAEMIDRFSANGYTKKDAARIIEDFTHIVMETLAAGEDVVLYGFGTFKCVDVAPKRIRTVRDRTEMVIPGHKEMRFVPGYTLKCAVKEGYIRE